MSKRSISSETSKSSKKSKVVEPKHLELSEAEQRARALEWAERNNLLSPNKIKKKTGPVKPLPSPTEAVETKPATDTKPEESQPRKKREADVSENVDGSEKRNKKKIPKAEDTQKKQVDDKQEKDENKDDNEQEQDQDNKTKNVPEAWVKPSKPPKEKLKKSSKKTGSKTSVVATDKEKGEKQKIPKLEKTNLPTMIAPNPPEPNVEPNREYNVIQPIAEVKHSAIPFYAFNMSKALLGLGLVAISSVISYYNTNIGIYLLVVWTGLLFLYSVILSCLSVVNLFVD